MWAPLRPEEAIGREIAQPNTDYLAGNCIPGIETEGMKCSLAESQPEEKEPTESHDLKRGIVFDSKLYRSPLPLSQLLTQTTKTAATMKKAERRRTTNSEEKRGRAVYFEKDVVQ